MGRVNIAMDKEFQTRDYQGRLAFYSSLEDAINAFKNDELIWKISFEDMRWLPKRKGEKKGATDFESLTIEGHLNNLSPTYANEQDGEALFFVRSDGFSMIEMRKLEVMLKEKKITKEEFDFRHCTLGMEEILSEKELLEKHGK